MAQTDNTWTGHMALAIIIGCIAYRIYNKLNQTIARHQRLDRLRHIQILELVNTIQTQNAHPRRYRPRRYRVNPANLNTVRAPRMENQSPLDDPLVPTQTDTTQYHARPPPPPYQHTSQTIAPQHEEMDDIDI